jgi:hypothetical protein
MPVGRELRSTHLCSHAQPSSVRTLNHHRSWRVSLVGVIRPLVFSMTQPDIPFSATLMETEPYLPWNWTYGGIHLDRNCSKAAPC